MRLICPNCDAQYEVSDDAIPDGGRDVQCSNCGHAWFQLSPEVEAALAAEEELFEAPPDAALGGSAVRTAPVAAQSMGDPAGWDDDDAEDDAAAPKFDGPAPLQRRTLDESLMAVLREEAEREAAVRKAETPRGLETQTELGLEAATAAAAVNAATNPSARRIAQMKGIDPDAPPPTPARPATRAEMLPDIEEINSTLRASSDRSADAEMQALPDLNKRRSGSFRNGFALMMILATILVVTYVMASRIGEQIPGAAPAMKQYVALVDSARLWLDGVMRQAIGAIRGVSGP